MMDNLFYEFVHKCDAMPDGVRFVKMRGAESSQFSIDRSKKGVVFQLVTLIGFRFCPYCGKDIKDIHLDGHVANSQG